MYSLALPRMNKTKKCTLCGIKLTKQEVKKYCMVSEQDSEGDIILCPTCLLSKAIFATATIETEKEIILAKWNKHRIALE
jgi:hypothetical protein